MDHQSFKCTAESDLYFGFCIYIEAALSWQQAFCILVFVFFFIFTFCCFVLCIFRALYHSQRLCSATFERGAAGPSVSVIHTHVSYPLLTFARNCTFYILYIMHKMYKTYYIPIHSMAYALCSATLLDSSVPDCTLPAEQCTHGALFQLDLIAV